MDLTFIDTKGLEFLFITPDYSDLDLANDILEEKNADADDLEKLIEYLNTQYPDWHFFLRDCRIQKVRRYKANQ